MEDKTDKIIIQYDPFIRHNEFPTSDYRDNTDCYLSFFQCDNDCDCNDCSDENACGGGGGGSTAACNNGEFHCNITDLCIPASWECDGETDCDDGTDEHSGCSCKQLASLLV